MEEKIKAGMEGTKEMVVQLENLASFMGNLGADVLSTHYVVLLMEQAARNAIEGSLPSDKITVGTGINIKHMAATPLGSKVRAEAVLEKKEGRRLVFHVVVHDEVEMLAEGKNEQLIVSLDRFVEKVKNKQRRHDG